MKLIKAMATVAGLTGVSRIAGFTRDILTAAILGAGPVGDAFFVALKLPNFFRRVTAEGAFSVAFVPLYTETLEQEGKERADLFASNAFMVMLSILSVVVLLAMLVMPYIIYVIAPGFSNDLARYDLAVELSRVTFPYLLLMSLTALLGGVLNANDRFAPFAFAPTLFNLCLIAALLSAGYFDTAGHAMAWGVFGAGIVQFVWLWVAAKRARIGIRFKKPEVSVKIRKVFKLMGPGVIGAGVIHINLFADMIIASFLASGSISYLYYADRLNQLPLGVVGIAVGAALLPMLSKALSKGDNEEARHLFNRALEACLLLALPAAVALMVIPHALISVLFERGAFSAADSDMSAMVLGAYAIGLPAYIAVKVFSTAHWSRQDTVTPVKISVAATVTNILLSIALIQVIGVTGIALATGLTGWMQFVLHMRALKNHEAARFDDKFKRVVLRIVLSTCVMGAVLFIVAGLLDAHLYADEVVVKVLALSVLVVSGLVSYGTCVVLSGAVRVKDLKRYFAKG